MAKKKNIRNEYMECPICKRRHKVKKWEEDMGKLKNQTIVSDAFCSKKCKDIFYLYIELDFIEERKEDILKALEKLGAIKKKTAKKKPAKKQVKKKQVKKPSKKPAKKKQTPKKVQKKKRKR